MATYTGALNTFGFSTYVNRAPQIRMIPSAAGTSSAGVIYPKDPVAVTFTTSSDFTVDLAASEFVTPGGLYFMMEIKWLDGEGVAIGYDCPPWRFYTAAAGGDLSTMIDRPLVSGEWFVGTDVGVPATALAGDFILNPTTGQYDQIQEL